MLHKSVCLLFMVAFCCGALCAQESSLITSRGTAAAVAHRDTKTETLKTDSLKKALQKGIAKQIRKTKPVCIDCGEEIISQGQHCEANDGISLCRETNENENRYAGNIPAFNGVGDPHAHEYAQTDSVTAPTCSFCDRPILKNGQKCTGKNPFQTCTNRDMNYGEKLHKGEYQGREKEHYNVPFESHNVILMMHQLRLIEKELQTRGQTMSNKIVPAAQNNTYSRRQTAEKHCTECGRPESQIKKHGHNHKPPYNLQ